MSIGHVALPRIDMQSKKAAVRCSKTKFSLEWHEVLRNRRNNRMVAAIVFDAQRYSDVAREFNLSYVVVRDILITRAEIVALYCEHQGLECYDIIRFEPYKHNGSEYMNPKGFIRGIASKRNGCPSLSVHFRYQKL